MHALLNLFVFVLTQDSPTYIEENTTSGFVEVSQETVLRRDSSAIILDRVSLFPTHLD